MKRLIFVVYSGYAGNDKDRKQFVQDLGEDSNAFAQRVCDYVENQAEILSVEEDE